MLAEKANTAKTCDSLNAKLTVVIVIGTLGIGGTERQLSRLATEMQKRGHSVSFVILGDDGPLSSALRSQGIRVTPLGFHGFGFRDSQRRLRPWVVFGQSYRLLRLIHLFRELRPDVCYSALFWANVFAMPASALAGIPARVSGRRGLTSSLMLPRRYRMLGRLAEQFAQMVVANSTAVAQDVARQERIHATRIRVIHNGVDVPTSTAHVAREPAVGAIVANLHSYKGHADVLAALALLDDPPTIRMIGEGPERGRLQEMINRLQLADRCILEGPKPNVTASLLEVQFFVLASHTEGLPNAILEAMAVGLPVVATRVGGVAELLEEGVNGFLVAPGDRQGLAKAIEKVAGDPELRLRFGAAARARAAQFPYGTCTDKHLRLFADLKPPACARHVRSVSLEVDGC